MTTKRAQTTKSGETATVASHRVQSRTTGYVAVERLLAKVKMQQSRHKHPTQRSSFWTPKTFDELAREQGIVPLEDWKQIAGGWPKDADFEKFLADIRASRAE